MLFIYRFKCFNTRLPQITLYFLPMKKKKKKNFFELTQGKAHRRNHCPKISPHLLAPAAQRRSLASSRRAADEAEPVAEHHRSPLCPAQPQGSLLGSALHLWFNLYRGSRSFCIFVRTKGFPSPEKLFSMQLLVDCKQGTY